MPGYRVEAVEKFLVRTTYFLEAATADEAKRLCRGGEVAYDSHRIEEGDDEWLETILVEPEKPLRFAEPAYRIPE